jgi:hypothetical protein
MYRRRRRRREIAFSFDSFLDVVANVVGVIIRLILVAWVGARSYHTVMSHTAANASSDKTPGRVAAAPSELPAVHDPLEPELARHRLELEKQQQRLLEQLSQCKYLETVNTQSTQQLTTLSASEQAVLLQRGQLDRAAGEQAVAAQGVHLSLAELEKRSQQLAEELREMEKLPPLTKTLHYHTPISRPVHSEELHFECRQGRVSFIDIQAFLIEVRQRLEDEVNQLRTQWAVDGVTGPIGAFRLRYTVEREKSALDTFNGSPGLTPPAQAGGSFRYGLTGWVVEPLVEVRGESAQTALAANAEFRRLTEALDPDHTVVTLWVYPDSFALYRQLRDYLHEHNIEVAGRPLPAGVPIASTRQGVASRGQ